MVQRVLIGKFPDGDSSPNGYGLRISKPGYNVNVANPDNERLIFNSDWQSLLPVHAVGTIAVNNNTASQSFPDLGYIPHSVSLINDGNWQQYVTANSIVRPTASFGVTSVSLAQINMYNYEADTYPNLRINVFSNRISVFCSNSVSVFYTIYKLSAFSV